MGSVEKDKLLVSAAGVAVSFGLTQVSVRARSVGDAWFASVSYNNRDLKVHSKGHS